MNNRQYILTFIILLFASLFYLLVLSNSIS